MIEMKDVYKKYPNGVIASNGISVKINKGEFVYVVGPSGAGKSTFIKLMYREERATSGSIIVNNTDVTALRDQKVPLLRRQLGVVFQDFKLLPRLTVYENIAFALEVIEQQPTIVKEKVMHVIAKVGLAKKAQHFPHELSGGEQQRVAIARAIVNKPAVVIADEPTGNLDPDTAWGIMDIFHEINQDGTTIVMATHNKDIVNSLRRRVIAIDGGEIVRDEYGGDYGYES
ncbi:cell division ATP-binding protein FtsE [Caryophanon tenue]|uniref:Cell division ATP-binding protein FtsE n=1 Tax=Caryophanon tenue TaxID=33978 RepID=A0A1C0YJT3_9BACL|nr:cell division ATP-binding protein FtsE [Caryophanon tenue]OCS87447.1 cell division ATP-binding protein FtsE [Caryophanon tenue]